MTWSERRRAALTAAASEAIAELTAKYGAKAIERALAGRAPAAMMPADVEELLDAERELAGAPDRLEDVRLSDLLDTAAAMLVGPSKPGERPPLDRYFDQATAAEIDRLGPYREGDDVTVEGVEDTPAPVRAEAPPTATLLRPTPAPWLQFAARREATKILGCAPRLHAHGWDEGRCTVVDCGIECTHPPQTIKGGKCGVCSMVFTPATCPGHYLIRGQCVRCGHK